MATGKMRAGRARAQLKTPSGIAAVLLIAAMLFLAIAGPSIWGRAAATDNTSAILAGSSAAHPFGTDNLGRDLLARTLVATRLSLELALAATALGASGGILIGMVPGVLGGRIGRLIGSGIGMALAFPGLIIAIFFAVIFGARADGAVLALALAYAPGFARLAQTLTASVTGKEFVAAARILGIRMPRILVRHVLPNIAEPLAISVSVSAGGTLIAFAGLSFLGLGVQIPDYDWGLLLSQGLDRIYLAPLAALGPGLAIVLAGLTFQLVGELIARHARGMGPAVPPVPSPAPAASTPATTQVSTEADDAILRAENLTVRFAHREGISTPVRDVSLTVRSGEIVGIVGESGSGKTLLGLACANLLPSTAALTASRLSFMGRDLRDLPSSRSSRALLGMRLGLIYQNPASALNPAVRVERQLTEAIRQHAGLSRYQARDRAVAQLKAVAMPAPRRRLRQYPHELSGGMKQRAVIALSTMGQPALIIADEPTTALDTIVQAQILALLREVNEKLATAALLISHDIAVVAAMCERVIVMYAGRIVEEGPAGVLLADPVHPYTRALIQAVPAIAARASAPLATIPGRPPDPLDPPPGCPFAPRCERADVLCHEQMPGRQRIAPGHFTSCWHPVADAAGAEAS
ncbi:MAG TPA: dipeptide/oligopeptide/nickel ABC transporter permease/ATP-binding protein [Streptosporangiaceae bacterium]|nr:dipeptide/oligopeptide/nickel ABC transporter permease/ATP-binding protein [Streptosporangiaceae bacterium]